MSAPVADDFAGFGTGAASFFRALTRHNEREWFQANRDRYEREVRAPFSLLVEEMDARLATIAPEIVGTPARSLFRIHRDVRFSADKRPYKTNAAAWFYHAGGGRGVGRAQPHGGAGFYVEIGATGGAMGGGVWMPPRPTLARIRARLDKTADAAEFASLLDASAVRRRFGIMPDEAMLKRMPRGFPASHPAAELLRHQSFTLGRALTLAELASPRLPDRLAKDFTLLVPFVRWLNSAMGLRPAARR